MNAEPDFGTSMTMQEMATRQRKANEDAQVVSAESVLWSTDGGQTWNGCDSDGEFTVNNSDTGSVVILTRTLVEDDAAGGDREVG